MCQHLLTYFPFPASPKHLVRKLKQVRRHGARNVKYHRTPQIIVGDHACGMQTVVNAFMLCIDAEEMIG